MVSFCPETQTVCLPHFVLKKLDFLLVVSFKRNRKQTNCSMMIFQLHGIKIRKRHKSIVSTGMPLLFDDKDYVPCFRVDQKILVAQQQYQYLISLFLWTFDISIRQPHTESSIRVWYKCSRFFPGKANVSWLLSKKLAHIQAHSCSEGTLQKRCWCL